MVSAWVDRSRRGKRFVAGLPAEVDLENDNKCLSVPNRPFFSKGIETAIASAGTPLTRVLATGQ
jgi:hypothetical protein